MVSTPKTVAAKKEALEKRLARLTEDYAGVMEQIDREGDANKRLELQRTAEYLFTQMKQVETELNQLEASEYLFTQMEQVETELNQLEASEYYLKQRDLDIQEKLPLIDFREAMDLIVKITSEFGREGGTALFLLDNSYSTAGELCIYRIKKLFEEKTSSFKHIKVELLYGSNNELGLLEEIGRYLNVYRSPQDKIEKYISQIIKTICRSLQSGSVVFIEIKKWNCLPDQQKILPWFVKNFWIRLINQYHTTIHQNKLRRVRFIALIDSESQLSPECMAYCNQVFDGQKILRLPLNERWTEEDIKNWLENYSRLPGSKIDLMAKQIYLKTMNGVPLMVCDAIKEEFN